MFLSALLQYGSADNTFSSNIRYRWEYIPGSEFFVVWTDEHDTRPEQHRPAQPRLRRQGDPAAAVLSWRFELFTFLFSLFSFLFSLSALPLGHREDPAPVEAVVARAGRRNQHGCAVGARSTRGGRGAEGSDAGNIGAHPLVEAQLTGGRHRVGDRPGTSLPSARCRRSRRERPCPGARRPAGGGTQATCS